MSNVESMDYTHSHPSIIASLFGTVHCTFSPFRHFYIIFGTNLLTGGPVQIAVFAYFSVSKERNIKRSPNGMKPSGT